MTDLDFMRPMTDTQRGGNGRLRYALMLAMVLVAFPALAFNEPDSFRGVPWGATLEETKAALDKAWEATSPGVRDISKPDCLGNSYCWMRAVVGRVAGTAGFHFHEGKFVMGNLSFPSSRYVEIREIFVERYGQPTSTSEEVVKNKMGASFTNEYLRWRGEKVSITLRRYTDKLDTGRGTLVTKEEEERLAKQREKAIQKGKGDL
jgi:hypothetical protein